MAKLFFVGDSITAGAWDMQGGWANRLISRIMDKKIKRDQAGEAFYCLPYNLGVSGDTVADILHRLEQEVTTRLDPDDPNETIQLVFAIGANDSVHMVTENRPRFTDEEFRRNLEDLIVMSHKIAGSIQFIGLPPVDDDLLDPIPWAPDKAYRNENVQRFENILSVVCAQHDVVFLPLNETWLEMPDFKKYLIDGVHPNTKGHQLLAQQIGDFLLTDAFFKFHTG